MGSEWGAFHGLAHLRLLGRWGLLTLIRQVKRQAQKDEEALKACGSQAGIRAPVGVTPCP